MKSHLFIVTKANPSVLTVKTAANCKQVIKVELVKDKHKAPMQINLPMLPFITATFRTSISNLTAKDTLKPDKSEKTLPLLSFLSNPILPNNSMILTVS